MRVECRARETARPRALVRPLRLLGCLTRPARVAANGAPGRVALPLAPVDCPRAQLMDTAFVLGWLAGIASAWSFVRKLTSERTELRRSLRLAEAEIRNLRPLPQDRG